MILNIIYNVLNLIQYFIHETINEIIGKFDLNHFKKIEYLDDQIAYAKKYLPHLGTGSSRIVFALSGHKVLKIALSNRGYGQNNAELDIYSNPLTKRAVAKILDASSKNNNWIISEIAKPFASREEFERYTGFSFQTFTSMIYNSSEITLANREKDLKYHIEQLKSNIDLLFKTKGELLDYEKIASDILNKKISVNSLMYNEIDYRYSNIKKLKEENYNKEIISLAKSIRELNLKLNLLMSDLTVPSHYGVTNDGRIVLIDYGFTSDVANMYY